MNIQNPPRPLRATMAGGLPSVQFGAAKQEIKQIQDAFKTQNFKLTETQAKAIQSLVENAVGLIKKYPKGNSQIDFSAIQIGSKLGLNLQSDTSLKERIVSALKQVAKGRTEPPRLNEAWDRYFDKTVNMTNDRKFTEVVQKKGFSPVKISWEDIGRYQGSAWGNRISDVGIWVRKDEKDPQSAQLALSVRRDNNFRDKILVAPSQNIKIHKKEGDKHVEVSLPERLKELGLTSKDHDDNVIVSNQFAIVPVPGKDMAEVSKEGVPPRSAFTFSIYPYGSKNLVITDVIEGSSTAVVGGRGHQLLFANVDGQRAPFTASRAADRKDLAALEKKLKAQGMDVDVQRYYLIQVPLKDDNAIQPSNMGEPPMNNRWNDGPIAFSMTALESVPTRSRSAAGLDKVAIGTGDTEGPYNEGAGFRGKRAEEPVRVTVVYFVTPKGEVTQKDMDNFSKTFESWDKQAIWGGSFVVPENNT